MEMKRFIEAGIVGIASVLIGLIILWVFAKGGLIPREAYYTSNWNKNYALEMTFFIIGFMIYFVSSEVIRIVYKEYSDTKQEVSKLL